MGIRTKLENKLGERVQRMGERILANMAPLEPRKVAALEQQLREDGFAPTGQLGDVALIATLTEKRPVLGDAVKLTRTVPLKGVSAQAYERPAPSPDRVQGMPRDQREVVFFAPGMGLVSSPMMLGTFVVSEAGLRFAKSVQPEDRVLVLQDFKNDEQGAIRIAATVDDQPVEFERTRRQPEANLGWTRWRGTSASGEKLTLTLDQQGKPVALKGR